MLYPRICLISTLTLIAAIALSQLTVAQTPVNSSPNKISTVESWQKKTTAQGNAEILGTIEIGTEAERSPTLATSPVPRTIQIKPEQIDLFTPRPVTPAETDARIDRGIQVIIDNP